MEHIGRLAEKDLTVNFKALVAEGDTVVAITEVTAGGETGEDADVFTVRNGKTVSARVHGDTGLLERFAASLAPATDTFFPRQLGPRASWGTQSTRHAAKMGPSASARAGGVYVSTMFSGCSISA